MKKIDADQMGLFVHTDDRRVALKDTYTIAEVCRFFGVSENTIRNEIAAGELPVVRFGERIVRISRPDLLAFIGRNRADDDDDGAPVADERSALDVLQRLIAARLDGELTKPWHANNLAKRIARDLLDRARELGV